MTIAEDLFDASFWRRYMLETFLKHWLDHAPDCTHGGYIADFGRTWDIAGPCHKSLVSQARLVYTFSAGLRHTSRHDMAQAAARGIEFLNLHMADTQQGGWLWRVQRDGSVLEPTKYTYGLAFVIFGLAEYARATGQKVLAQRAQQTLQVLYQKASGPGGGFWTLMDRQWQPLERQRSQNPHMHLMEACLSLYDVTGWRLALETALDIARMANERFVHPDHGCLEEFFHEDWTRLADDTTPAVLVGHQFEWCWLLHRLADRTGQEPCRHMADRLLEWGLRFGTDHTHGGFYNACDRQGRPVDTNKSHWTESEALRAILYMIVQRGRTELREVFTQAAEFAFTHLADPQYGGWYCEVAADGRATNPNKGGEWKLDYHMTSLCDEAVRLLG